MGAARPLLGHVALAVVITCLPVTEAEAHWCHDLWASSYNLVLRPASDVVDVPSADPVTLDVWVQNNMGYPLYNFALTAQASGYTINVGRHASKVSGYLMPGEKLLHTLTISKAGGASLAVESIGFFVSFGVGSQSSEYPQAPGRAVVIKKSDGNVAPVDFPNLGQGWDQADHLTSSALADYGNLSQALDKLLQEYCSGRASWDHSGSGVQTTYCSNVSSTTCPPRQGGSGGTKYDWQKLWSAQELAYRKSSLGARAGVLRARLRCGWADDNLPFRAFPLFVLGYLGEDAAARTFIEGIITSGNADDQAIAKAALLLFKNAADATRYRADVTAAVSSSNGYVAAVSAAALGIADHDDAKVEQVLLANARWVEPDTDDNGYAFFVSHLLALVAWDRRGWATNAGDTGGVSFYGDTTPQDTTSPKAPTGAACRASPGGSVRVTWNAVTQDVSNAPETVAQYRVYWGNAPGDRAHVDTTSGTLRDYPGLDGAATYYYSVVAVDAAGNAGAASSEVSCVPVYAPVARISCNPTGGLPPLHVVCDGDQSTDPNGASDITGWSFTLDGGGQQTTQQATYDISAVGRHAVLLRVTDSTGQSSTAQASINVGSPDNAPPEAHAAANPTTGQAPLSVTFSSAGSADADAGQTLTFRWDFQDGANSTDANPTHVFQGAGTFDVLLTVTDDGTPPASATAVVTVDVTGNRPPDLTGVVVQPTSGRAPLVVRFDASPVTDPDGNQVTTRWSFGDGSAEASQATVDHTYAQAGTFEATLTVDDDGTPVPAHVTRTFTVTVGAGGGANHAPDCGSATVSPLLGQAPLHLVLDASGCRDPDGDGLTFLWRVPTSYTTEETFTTPRAELDLSAPGSATVHLLVRDDAASSMETSRDFAVTVSPATSGDLSLDGSLVGGCACQTSARPERSSVLDLFAWALLIAFFGKRRR